MAQLYKTLILTCAFAGAIVPVAASEPSSGDYEHAAKDFKKHLACAGISLLPLLYSGARYGYAKYHQHRANKDYQQRLQEIEAVPRVLLRRLPRSEALPELSAHIRSFVVGTQELEPTLTQKATLQAQLKKKLSTSPCDTTPLKTDTGPLSNFTSWLAYIHPTSIVAPMLTQTGSTFYLWHAFFKRNPRIAVTLPPMVAVSLYTVLMANYATFFNYPLVVTSRAPLTQRPTSEGFELSKVLLGSCQDLWWIGGLTQILALPSSPKVYDTLAGTVAPLIIFGNSLFELQRARICKQDKENNRCNNDYLQRDPNETGEEYLERITQVQTTRNTQTQNKIDNLRTIQSYLTWTTLACTGAIASWMHLRSLQPSS